MADGDSGYKWWLQYVLVPLVAGGAGVVALLVYLRPPTPPQPGPAKVSTPPAGPTTQVGPDVRPPGPDSAPVAGSGPDQSTAAVAAMQWIESRCGPGIELVVSTPPGSSLDGAARAIATALSGSGVRPVPVVTNRTGVFMANGAFSVQKFDDWQRTYTAKDGCLLVLVPNDVSEQFARPRLDATVADKSYGLVLPRGVLSDAATQWNTVFIKAGRDPDFQREVTRVRLKVEVVPLP